MKKQFTLIALLVAICIGKTFAGGPTAPYRFDSTFANNGFLVDTSTGGANSLPSYREIMVSNTGSTLHQFWLGGICNTTFLANKFSANGSLLFSRVGEDLSVGSGQTGVMLFNKVYLGGIANAGGYFQNIALNFDGSNHSIFNQPAGADSFLTPALYAQGVPIGSGASNCSAVLANGHIVTVVKDVSDSTYITEFDPAASGGASVITYPMFNSGGTFMYPKALRAIPGTNNYAVLIYDANTSTSQLYFLTNGVATASYNFSTHYEAMIAVSSTQVLLGGDNLLFVNVSNGTSVVASANVPVLVEQLTRDEQTGEIYAYTSERIFAITSAGDLDTDYNPDGQGNNFAYTYVQANYFLGSTNLTITDMEMQGGDILLAGYSLQINGGSVATGYASFVIKVRGKVSNSNPCIAPDITVALSGTTNFCEGTSISLGPLNTTGDSVSYQWYKDGVAINNAMSNSFAKANATTADNGNYYMIATNNCGADTSTTGAVNVVVTQTPTLSVSGNTLTASGYDNGATLSWTLNGSPINGVSADTYVATQSGMYQVTSTYLGCAKQSGVESVIISSIDDEKNNVSVQLYPNPVKESLTLNITQQIESITIYNLLGEQVIFEKGADTKLNVSALAAGVYSLQLKTTNGSQATKKFVKE